MKVLITGSAGFIGHNLAGRLLANGFDVVGVDAFTPYYDVKLKQDRSAELEKNSNYSRFDLEIEADVA